MSNVGPNFAPFFIQSHAKCNNSTPAVHIPLTKSRTQVCARTCVFLRMCAADVCTHVCACVVYACITCVCEKGASACAC